MSTTPEPVAPNTYVRAKLIEERTRAGREAAKRRGQHMGRSRKLTGSMLDHAKRELAKGCRPKEIATELGVSDSTLWARLPAMIANYGPKLQVEP